jgi:hypothetical protein
VSPFQTAVAVLGLAGTLFTLGGLLLRRTIATATTFAAYLAFMCTAGALVLLWPDRFYTTAFWTFKQLVFDALELAMVVELAYWIFLGFPGAARTVRGLILALLVATFAAVVVAPVSAEGSFMLGGLRLRLELGAAWMFAAMAGLTLYYDIPVRPIHRAILFGMGIHYFVFGTILERLTGAGPARDRALATLQQGVFVAITCWWAIAAWRKEPVLSVDPELAAQLQPWRRR